MSAGPKPNNGENENYFVCLFIKKSLRIEGSGSVSYPALPLNF